MQSVLRQSSFVLVLATAGWGLALVVGVWQLVVAYGELREQERRFHQVREEAVRLALHSPRLDLETSAAIAADVQEAEARLRELVEPLLKTGMPSGATVAGKAEGFFEVRAFLERYRALALARGVELRPGECFGFGSYERVSPGRREWPIVCRQMGHVAHVLECLLAAQPAALLSMRRERPETLDESRKRAVEPVANQPAPGWTGSGDIESDFFVPIAGLRLKVAELIGSDMLRVEFSGSTTVLRRFINGLVTMQIPAVVRGVEAEPITSAERTSDQVAKGVVDGATDRGEKHSKFTVTIAVIYALQEGPPS